MRVLLIGERPDTVDFSDPVLPPGIDAAKIQAGIDLAMKDMADRGWDADQCMVRPDESAATDVEKMLEARSYDCIVIGGGIRMPASRFALFETLVNVVHRAAPHAAIAFNTGPQNTADAAARWLKPDA